MMSMVTYYIMFGICRNVFVVIFFYFNGVYFSIYIYIYI